MMNYFVTRKVCDGEIAGDFKYVNNHIQLDVIIYILLNNNSAYRVILRSSKGFDTCKIGGPKWPCIL